MKYTLYITLSISTSSCAVAMVSLPLAYSADFVSTAGFAHATSSPPHLCPDTISGPNWEIGYFEVPDTDVSINTFGAELDALVSVDWGGAAYFETDVIDVFGINNIEISGIGSTLGTSVFNNSETEKFQWFYSLDGVKTYGTLLTSDGSLNTDASWKNIDVSGATSLRVGFEFDINGSGDGFSISSLDVAVVPESNAYALLLGTCALGFVILRRRL